MRSDAKQFYEIPGAILLMWYVHLKLVVIIVSLKKLKQKCREQLKSCETKEVAYTCSGHVSLISHGYRLKSRDYTSISIPAGVRDLPCFATV